MDKRAKVCLIIGAILLLVGVGGFALGIAYADDIEDGQPTFVLEDVTNGTLSVLDDDGQGDLGFTFFVKAEFIDANEDGTWDHCDSTSVNITLKPGIVKSDWSKSGHDLDGDFYYEIEAEGEGCSTNREMNKHYYFENDSYIKLGRACYACGVGEFSFESNQSVYVVNDDDWNLGPTIGIVILGFIGGIGSLCCGIVFLLVGIILIFTLKDEDVQPMMMNQDGQFVIQQNMASTQMIQQPSQTVIEPYSPPRASVDVHESANETVNEPYSFPTTSSPELDEK